MTTPAPHSPENIALARDTLTDTGLMASVTPLQRAELVKCALDILRTDRTARLGQTPIPTHARVIAIPLAVFQAGPARRHRPRLTLLPHPHTPGDAA